MACHSQLAEAMIPDEFRRGREALGLTHQAFAKRLGVTAADVIRCERAPRFNPFVLALAMAYVELRLEAQRREVRQHRSRRWPASKRPAAANAALKRSEDSPLPRVLDTGA